MEIKLKENERIDDLQYKGLKIIQNKNGFCFGIDAVLLSDFAKEIKEGANVVDLGAGTGILGILLAGKTKLNKIIGIEIQPDVCEMASRSINLNNMQNRVEIINEDIKNIENILETDFYNAVVTNPPYKKIGSGAKNQNEKESISRHEVKCTLEDIIRVSDKLLKNCGSLYMVHRPERLADIIYCLREYKLEPKKIKFVYPSYGKEPNLILIKAVKNGNPFLKIENPLFVYKEDGTYTDDILKIYGREKGE